MNYKSILSFICIFLLLSHHVGKIECSFCKRASKITTLWKVFDKSIRFYLHRRDIVSHKIYFSMNSTNLPIDPSLRTTLLIHGFRSSSTADWVDDMTKELLLWQDMNVITVDWSRILQFNYRDSAKEVKDVAKKIQKLFKKLEIDFNKKLRDWHYFHFIGHSLGAQAAGQAAKLMKKDVFVHRITGLDPARPYFDKEGLKYKLRSLDARFVDIIHTNSHPTEETLGFYEPLGDMDFYPNGGDKQPFCNIQDRTLSTLIRCISHFFFGIDGRQLLKNYQSRQSDGNDLICDHSQAPIFFTESFNIKTRFIAHKVPFNSLQNITKCSFQSCENQTCVEMGINAEKYNKKENYGTYYLNIPNCNFQLVPEST